MDFESLDLFDNHAHAVYRCTYHIVFSTKYRKKILFGEVCDFMRQQILELCDRKNGTKVVEMRIEVDHCHLIIVIPPKYPVSSIIGYLKGKLSAMILERFDNLNGEDLHNHIWARGYFVRSLGLNEQSVRGYVKNH